VQQTTCRDTAGGTAAARGHGACHDMARPPRPATAEPTKGDAAMLKWAIIFGLISLVAALFGFTGIAAGAAGIAKVLFVLFLIAFIVVLAMALMGAKAVSK
jgi:uncharacterized membrane protein YtjA (UPF0391 family)